MGARGLSACFTSTIVRRSYEHGHPDPSALRVVARVPSSSAQVPAVKACVAAARGDNDAALRHLAVAETRYDAAGMRLFAAACRFRRGERTGDAALVEDARATMQAAGVKRPERWAAMYMPGF